MLKIAYQLGQEQAVADFEKQAGLPTEVLARLLLDGGLGAGIGALAGGEGNRGRGAVIGGLTGAGISVGDRLGSAVRALGKVPGGVAGGVAGGIGGYYGGKALAPDKKSQTRLAFGKLKDALAEDMHS